MGMTQLIMEELAKIYGSDYAISKALGKNTSYVNSYRSKGRIFSDEVGLKAAQLLDMPVDLVIMGLATDRALDKPWYDDLADALKETHERIEAREKAEKEANEAVSSISSKKETEKIYETVKKAV